MSRGLRYIVRQLILEAENERSQLQGHARRLQGEIRRDDEQQLPARAQSVDHELMLADEFYYAYHARRDIKKHWNDKVYKGQSVEAEARRAWWAGGSDANVKTVHWIALIQQTKNENGLMRKLREYVNREGSGPKPELSTVGYTDRIVEHASIGVLYQTRTITWAYLADSFTEFLSSVGFQAEEHFTSGKIPKRPRLDIQKQYVIMGPEDMKGTWINECIISAYGDPVYVLVKSKLSEEGLQKAIAIITDSGNEYEIV